MAKKVVRVESTGSEAAEPAADWKPTPEAKAKATQKRSIAAILWVVAIGLEAFAIFWVLKQTALAKDSDNLVFPTWAMVALIASIVVIGALSVIGSQLWKQANRLDPARKSETVRFFVQNQLGAIIAIIAFVPLIIMIFLNKNMSGGQKALAGTVGIVLAAVAVFFGIDFKAPSVEQYSQESNIVKTLTGKDVVYYTKSGDVFHVCSAVPDVNKDSKDAAIYEGTVAKAHEDGKSRLTLKWESEAVKYCGYTQAQVDAAKATLTSGVPAATPAASN
ncbi:MAG TPA: hypothetical protein VFU07_07425 [Candidatus Lumbricidophila sp.]|nr:hypothetical protein [Candidatus Lumbricidophila sp.]